jgi:hypothetical protein
MLDACMFGSFLVHQFGKRTKNVAYSNLAFSASIAAFGPPWHSNHVEMSSEADEELHYDAP